MDYSKEILNYLTQTDGLGNIVIAPQAPPINKRGQDIRVALNMVLSAQDVNDTIAALRNQASATEAVAPLGVSGVFSFGIRGMGRFRVSYAKQRGSRIASIVRIPSTIPDPESLSNTPAAMAALSEALQASAQGGILAVFGRSAIDNSILVYSLLHKINATERKVIYILERSLTFLMGHENSIVIQMEMNTDVQSMEEGVQKAFLFQPDIMYVGEIRPTDELPSLVHTAESGVTTVISSVASDEIMLLSRFRMQFKEPSGRFVRLIKKMARVSQGSDGRLSVEIIDRIPEA